VRHFDPGRYGFRQSAYIIRLARLIYEPLGGGDPRRVAHGVVGNQVGQPIAGFPSCDAIIHGPPVSAVGVAFVGRANSWRSRPALVSLSEHRGGAVIEFTVRHIPPSP
jgi:hypothetical protein